MKWQEIQISLSHPAAEALAVFLDEQEGVGVAMDDPAALMRLRERGGWEAEDIAEADEQEGEVRVRFYAVLERPVGPLLEQVHEFLQRLAAAGVSVGSARIDIRTVEEEDWAHAWKAFFTPTPVGQRLWIQPTWESGEVPCGRVRIWLDPGMAFGTGTHPTTRLCLEVLDRIVQGGETVMDVGCGSGILAIAAVLLGAHKALGVDIDSTAVRVAQENSRKNRVPDRTDFIAGTCDDLTGEADVIVANIIADVIMDILPCVAQRLSPTGLLIASGIIRDRLAEVEAALCAQGFLVEDVLKDGDWVAITARKEAGP